MGSSVGDGGGDRLVGGGVSIRDIASGWHRDNSKHWEDFTRFEVIRVS